MMYDVCMKTNDISIAKKHIKRAIANIDEAWIITHNALRDEFDPQKQNLKMRGKLIKSFNDMLQLKCSIKKISEDLEIVEESLDLPTECLIR